MHFEWIIYAIWSEFLTVEVSIFLNCSLKFVTSKYLYFAEQLSREISRLSWKIFQESLKNSSHNSRSSATMDTGIRCKYYSFSISFVKDTEESSSMSRPQITQVIVQGENQACETLRNLKRRDDHLYCDTLQRNTTEVPEYL